MSGVPMLHVPYKSTPPAIADLIGGQVQFMFVDLAAGLTTVKAGKMRAIAVTTQERTKLFPELPPVADTPELKGFDITSWNGVFAPAGTPHEVVGKLNRVLAGLADSAAFRARARASRTGFIVRTGRWCLGASAARLSRSRLRARRRRFVWRGRVATRRFAFTRIRRDRFA